MKFSEFNLNPQLAQAIEQKGFTEPSEVQQKTIPLIFEGKDIITQSKTGTGKTAAFSIPLLQLVDPSKKSIQAIVIVPTRELAMQVQKELHSLGEGQGVYSLPVFGGQSINVQLDKLRRGQHIVVATPGRLMDLMRRGAVKLNSVKYAVLDEADKMFDMGFREDIDYILSHCPKERQTLLFSATISGDIQTLASKHLKEDKEFIDISQDQLTVDEIDQFYIKVDPKRRVSILADLIHFKEMNKCLVFCKTQRTADWLARQLQNFGVKAESIHGGLSQNIRERILRKYKQNQVSVLISTNLVARGLHIDDISHIINFDFPDEQETYVHRIGRTARFGKRGEAITFCTNLIDVREIEKYQQSLQAPIQELVEQ